MGYFDYYKRDYGNSSRLSAQDDARLSQKRRKKKPGTGSNAIVIPLTNNGYSQKTKIQGTLSEILTRENHELTPEQIEAREYFATGEPYTRIKNGQKPSEGATQCRCGKTLKANGDCPPGCGQA